MDTVLTPRDLTAALRAAGVAETDSSTLGRAEYSSDASLYRVPPTVVAYPRDVDEVAGCLRVARELGVPITSRGSGTSIAGNAVGTGMVLDFRRHFRASPVIDPEARTATVAPGVVEDDLQRAAAAYGLRFGPDPSTHNRATIGGMIGNNACGSRALKYGRTADNVLSLDVLTAGGERLALAREQLPETSPVHAALHEIAAANLAVLRTELGRFTRQVSGYSLEHLLPERGFDVAKAFVGTEGSCGLLTSATLRLLSAPAETVLVVLGYPDMPAAADAVPTLLGHDPVAMEGIDARIVDVVRHRRGAAKVPELPRGQGWLFVELGGEDACELGAAARALAADAQASDHRIVADADQARALWRIREDGAGLSGRSLEGHPAHSGWEDAAVPPARLGGYLREFEALLGNYGLATMPYGHFGDGCVHSRIDFPFDARGGTATYREFLTEAARLAVRHEGSMSGEHGDGRTRGELLSVMYSPEAIKAFEAVKGAYDPANVLNPGIIVNPRPLDADIRVAAAAPMRRGLGLAYTDDAGDFSRAVHRCTGVGKCVVDLTSSGGVMCPSYVATGAEKDSTRGRARVLQEMLSGSVVEGGWRSPEVHEALDLCLSCKGCASDCPTGIDMASYKAEVLYQSYRGRIRPASHYSLGALPRWARLASAAPGPANRALAMKPLADLVKRAGGIDPRRDLPPFAERSFRDWFSRRVPEGSGHEPVLLWVDTFTDYFTPAVGKAAVRLLESLGFAVGITEKPECCGLTWITTGQLPTARRKIRSSLDAMRPHVAAGVPVVGLEPSCTAVFRSDAAELLGEAAPGARPTAEAMHTLAELLAAHRPDWEPPRLDGTEIVAQPHCHQHAVLGWEADAALLERAGARVRQLGGCCGLAGNFGVERGHYETSVAVAETALLPEVRQRPDAVLAADGFSCRTQLDALAGRPGRHLAEILTRDDEVTRRLR
jgi:FAD/FMN-containing dehydrogenase/Fe-S oxidoreductase